MNTKTLIACAVCFWLGQRIAADKAARAAAAAAQAPVPETVAGWWNYAGSWANP